jgi:hypothetical protein
MVFWVLVPCSDFLEEDGLPLFMVIEFGSGGFMSEKTDYCAWCESIADCHLSNICHENPKSLELHSFCGCFVKSIQVNYH